MKTADPQAGSWIAKPDSYHIKVGDFDGPLDLLLHLVRANEVDIVDIPIVQITEQYNDYLQLMEGLNLEVAGEYLVMASTLIHIKSRMLLPSDPELEDEAGEDPRTELVQQLLEYQRFKQAAENLSAMDSVRSLIWTRDGRVPSEFEGEELLTVEIFDLIKAFRGLIGRLSDEARLQLKRETVSVADTIHWLHERLENEETISLETLIKELETRAEAIALFLAMLEMMRLEMLVAFQRRTFSEIRIALRRDASEGSEMISSGAEAGERTLNLHESQT
jgi:segregation and condensation protein A